MDARPLIAVLVAASTFTLAACGSTTTVTKTVTVTNPAGATASGADTSAATSTTARRGSGAHRVPSGYKRCDANIRAKRETTTCGFAENTFYAYFIGSGATTLRVYSPAVGRSFTTRCSRGDATISCRTSDGGLVKFPRSAIDAYSEDQASAFAAAHAVGDTGVADTAASNPYSNPYDSPDATAGEGDDPSFCDTHDCIPNYPNGNGTTVQCTDGSYSHSGGIQGACSHHGGVR